MNEGHHIIVTTSDELALIVETAVEKAIGRLKLDAHNSETQSTEIVDRKELCRRFNITEQTAIRWEKKGKLPSMRIGDAVRYDFKKVLAALQTKYK